jgi:Fibronectin type III domain
MAIEIAGKKVNKWVLIGGAGVLVAGGIYMFRRSSASTSAGSTTPSSSAIDPVTGLPYSEDQTIDPNTGLTYLAEAQEYGSVSAAEAALLGSNSSAYDYAGGGDSSGTDTGSTTTTSTTTPTTPATPTTPTTPTAPTTPTTPAPAKTTYQFPAPSGLKVTSVGSTTVSISWNPVAAESGHSPTGYTVAVYQTNGKSVYQQVWQGTSGTISGLHTAWTYHVNVWANGGTLAPANSSVSFTTKS